MTQTRKGFTLLELLIVIAILAILATVVVLVLNPAEYLRQARDTQRMNDLDSLRSALNLYVVNSTSTTPLSAVSACGIASPKCTLSYSAPGPFTGGAACTGSTNVTVTGSGWVNVNLGSVPGGSPLPRLPLDPSNSGGNYYAYACDATATKFKTATALESTKFATYLTTDGGTQASFYEVGSDMTL